MPYKNIEDQQHYLKERYANDLEFRERVKASSRRNGPLRRKRIHEWWNHYRLTLRCERCGEDHPATLDFHHRDSSEKDRSLRDMVDGGYGPKRIQTEIEKCIVLCANCHRKEHWTLRHALQTDLP